MSIRLEATDDDASPTMVFARGIFPNDTDDITAFNVLRSPSRYVDTLISYLKKINAEFY